MIFGTRTDIGKGSLPCTPETRQVFSVAFAIAVQPPAVPWRARSVSMRFWSNAVELGGPKN